MGNLDDIRTILLRRENDRIAELEARLDVHRRRAEELAEVLPDALERAHQSGALAAPLAAPMADAVTTSVREQPERFAEALFPIMGPAIRKSIAEALRSFTQQINDAVEHSLTPRGLRWRMEAKRAGVSFSEYVLRQTRTFEVEQLFAMETGSGKLIGHQSDSSAMLKDKDAVSAMFSALQSFVRESFVGDSSDGLEIAEISGKTVWAVHGMRCSLAAAMSGSPPRALRRHLRDALDDVERLVKKGEQDGEQVVVDTAVIERRLQSAMHSVPDAQSMRSGSRWFSPASILFVLLLIGAAWWGYRYWQSHKNEAMVHEALTDVPGVVLSEVSFRGERGRISGFVDPLVSDIQSRLTDAGLQPDRIALDFTRYISLDPTVVARRVRTAMVPPPQVTISVQGDRVVVGGTADASWITDAQRTAAVIAGAELLDFNVAAIEPAATPVVTEAMRQLQADIEQQRITFDDADVLTAEAEQVIASMEAQLDRLDALSAEAGMRYALTILGATDPAGTEQINRPLRMARANSVRARIAPALDRAQSLDALQVGADTENAARMVRVVVSWSAPEPQ